jgi:integral membrane protein
METVDNAQTNQPEAGPVFLNRLRWMGFAEGTSTLVLFGIAMPLKYMADMPLAVRIVGSLHGFLFVGLCIMLMIATTRVPISRSMAVLGMFAAVLPFGPFIYDKKLVAQVDGIR